MLITYRRAGGMFALLMLAAVALAATVLTIALAVIVLIVAVATAAAVLLVRAVLPTSWRHRQVPPPAQWPQETIEATVMNPTASSVERDPLRMDSNKG